MSHFLPISIQMYSLRNIEGFSNQLDVAAAAGYQHVELFGSQMDDAVMYRDMLQSKGLSASSSHVGIVALRERFDAMMAACKVLGFAQLFMPAVPLAERDGDATYWLAMGKELGAMAVRAQDHGVQLGYHNHHWELKVKDGNKTALDLLFEGAGAVESAFPLTWQADIAWLVRGEGDPVALMSRYANRVVSAHAKDLAPSGTKLDEDGWADVGSGVLDWGMLSKAAKQNGAKWLVSEHDKPNDPTRFANASYQFLSSLK
jgi:sugar phosphate isomerase/epimerase